MKLRSKLGQIAIFTLLIFQVLFILFAMAINVALITHDKINLQSSLDIAVLYGAQKQAEVLNAIAHINYQMRQNYKLFTWRYRVLGTVIHRNISPGSFFCPPHKQNPHINYCRRQQSPNNASTMHPSRPGFYDRYFVCASTKLWAPNLHNTNLCKNEGIRIRSVNLTPISQFVPFSQVFNTGTRNLQRAFHNTCAGHQTLNAQLAYYFISQFRFDQRDRRLMIQRIYNKTLKQGRDLDGELIREGMLKTFKKNLTYTNLKILEESGDTLFQTFNSFKQQGLASLLKPIRIFPALGYLELDGNCSGTIKYTPDIINPNEIDALVHPMTHPSTRQLFKALIIYSKNPASDPNHLLGNLVTGFEPVLNKTIYFGAFVKFPYPFQLFLPLNVSLTLKASAFAKPFGGKIGPPKVADSLMEDVIKAGEGQVSNPTYSYLYQPNYSLYPGDDLGLIRRSLHTTYYLKKRTQPSSNPNLGSEFFYRFSHYTYLSPTFKGAPSGAPLPFDALANHFDVANPLGTPLLPARLMELTAIAPDIFDLTYYSILNNYMETYFPKICKLIGINQAPCDPHDPNKIASNEEGYLRGDFGYPYTQEYRQRNKAQHKVSVSLSPFFFHFKTNNEMNLTTTRQQTYYRRYRPPYLIRDPAHVLTSWAPTLRKERYDSHTFPEAFMRCQSPASKFIPSGCVRGGRSGYSVKLISCGHVRRLLNRPSNWGDYCG